MHSTTEFNSKDEKKDEKFKDESKEKFKDESKEKLKDESKEKLKDNKDGKDKDGKDKDGKDKDGKNMVCLFENHVFDPVSQNWLPRAGPHRRCLHSKCFRIHALRNRPIQVCCRENDCPDAGISCFLLHDNNKLRPLCRKGDKCIDIDCVYARHPSTRETKICQFGRECSEAGVSCFKLHPLSEMNELCTVNCDNYMCEGRHPPGRIELCIEGTDCWAYLYSRSLFNADQLRSPDSLTQEEKESRPICLKLHPKVMNKLCRWDDTEQGCLTFGCSFVHNPNSRKDCEMGSLCSNKATCPFKHPSWF